MVEKNSIRATYTDGVLKPREHLDLEDGEEVILSISSPRVSEDRLALMRSSAGSWKGTVDGDKLIEDIYSARLAGTSDAPEL